MRDADKKNGYILYIITFVVFSAFFLFRLLPNSFITIKDEMQYVVNGMQLCNGSALLMDDWNVTQLSGIFLYPLLAVYKQTVGSLVGVALYLRVLYFATKLVVAISLFLVLKHQNRIDIFTFSAVVFIYLHAHFNIHTLSYYLYYELAIEIILVMIVIGKKNNLFYFGIGILLSIATLAQPYAVIIFIAYVVSAIIGAYKYHKNNDSISKKRCLVNLAYVVFGIIPLLLFTIYILFSRAGLKQILDGVYMTLAGPYYGEIATNPLITAKMIVKLIGEFLSQYKSVTLVGVAIIIVGLKMQKQRAMQFSFALTLLGSILVLIRGDRFYENWFFLPFFYMAFVWTIRCKKTEYYFAFVLSCLAVVASYLGTDTGLKGAVSVFIMFAVLSLFIVSDEVFSDSVRYERVYAHDFAIEKTIAGAMVLISFMAAIFINFEWPINFKDSQFTLLKTGPLLGTVMCSDADLDRYNELLRECSGIVISDDRLLCASFCPMAYVLFDCKMGGSFFNYRDVLLEEYLNRHEDIGVIRFDKELAYDKFDFEFTDKEDEILKSYWNSSYELIEMDSCYYAIRSDLCSSISLR